MYMSIVCVRCGLPFYDETQIEIEQFAFVDVCLCLNDIIIIIIIRFLQLIYLLVTPMAFVHCFVFVLSLGITN